VDLYMRQDLSSRRVRFINTTFNTSKVTFHDANAGWFDYGFWVRGYVNDSNGNLLSDARIIYEDSGLLSSNPSAFFYSDTNSSGTVTFPLYELSRNQTHTFYHNNYSVYAAKPNYFPSQIVSLNITNNTNVSFTLIDGYYPVCVVQSSYCFGTIQEAVNNASSGMTVMITDNASYFENVIIDKSLNFSHNSSVGSPTILGSGTSLTIKVSNVAFDCNGMSLRYSKLNSESYGILIWSQSSNVNNVTIQNCNIIKTGSGGSSSSYRPAILGYGRSVTPATSLPDSGGTIFYVDNVIIRNVNITTIGDYSFGVLGVRSREWNLTNVHINTSGSYGYGVYGSSSSSWVLSDLSVVTSGSYGYGVHGYLSSSWVLSDLSVVTSGSYGYGVYGSSSASWVLSDLSVVTSGSSGYGVYGSSSSSWVLSDVNVSTSGSSGFGVYGSSSSSWVLSGLNISTNNTGASGLYIWASDNWNIRNSRISSLLNVDLYMRQDLSSRRVRFINTTFNTSKVTFHDANAGWFDYGFWVTGFVNSSINSLPIVSANVSWVDVGSLENNPSRIGFNLTNNTGYTDRIPIYILSRDRNYNYTHNNYTFNATKDGEWHNISYNVTDNLQLNFTLDIAGNDTNNPYWTNPSDNSTSETPKINEYIQMNLTLNDDVNLSTYIFSWNGTGSWQNDSLQSISGTEYNMSITKQVGLPRNNTVGWRVYFNDGGNNTNISDIFTFTVKNTPHPTPVLEYPVDGDDLFINRTPTFNWTATDADSDDLTFNIQVALDSGFNTLIIDEIGVTTNEFFQGTPLDLEVTYYWRVIANDSINLSAWSNISNFTIVPYTSITLDNDNIDFGTMGINQENDTTTNNPMPIIVRNTGNIEANITLNASSFWTSETIDTNFYQFKARAFQNNAFNETQSQMTFRNMSATKILAISRLNWYINSSGYIDLRILVPPAEPPGTRNSTIYLTAVTT